MSSTTLGTESTKLVSTTQVVSTTTETTSESTTQKNLFTTTEKTFTTSENVKTTINNEVNEMTENVIATTMAKKSPEVFTTLGTFGMTTASTKVFESSTTSTKQPIGIATSPGFVLKLQILDFTKIFIS